MAVTVASKRVHTNLSVMAEYVTLTLSGTYVTGGFPFNPSLIYGAPGTSPAPANTVVGFLAYSLLGYTYVLVGTGASAKIKILNGTAELAAASAVPEAAVTCKIEYIRAGG